MLSVDSGAKINGNTLITALTREKRVLMSAVCCTSVTKVIPSHPCDRECVLDHTVRACWEALAELAGTELSETPGDAKTWPDYWLGHVSFLLGHLLITMEQTEP